MAFVSGIVVGMLSLGLWDCFSCMTQCETFDSWSAVLCFTEVFFFLSSLLFAKESWNLECRHLKSLHFSPTAVQLAASQCLLGLISAASTDFPATLSLKGGSVVRTHTLSCLVFLPCFINNAPLPVVSCLQNIFANCTFTAAPGWTTSWTRKLCGWQQQWLWWRQWSSG